MWMVLCFIAQCCLFFFNRYELPAIALGLVNMSHRRMEHNYNHLQAALVGSTARPRTSTGTSFFSSASGTSPNGEMNLMNHSPGPNEQTFTTGTQLSVPLNASVSPQDREYFDRYYGEPVPRPLPHVPFLQPRRREGRQSETLEPQGQLHYTHSQGALSQGRMSRASSEAIFRPSSDQDDESYMYFLGGEVVIRRGNAPISASTSVDSVGPLNQSDSTSTLHSAAGSLEAVDEAAPSGLQAILDLTPRLSNVHDDRESSSGAPVFPTLESSRSMGRQRHLNNNE